MIFKLFGKSQPAKPRVVGVVASKAAPWPLPMPEEHVRKLISARIRYLASTGAVDGESPDLSSTLVDMGQSVAQRIKLREVWREEVFKFYETHKKAGNSKGGEWFD